MPVAKRRVVAALCGAAAVVVGYLVLAMPGMDHGDTAHDANELVELTAEQFESTLDARGVVVINVHVPDEGTIAGTDAAIAYDEILGAAQLPADADTQLLLYCRSGRMSRIAGDALVTAGYRNVAHLAGGMDAWTSSGRPLQPDSADAPATTEAS